MRISDIDLVYISFDEPNCERNWAELKYIAPWAVRVHGVKGFDNAHKAAARACKTDRIITVDGDTVPDWDFFDKTLTIPPELYNHVLSWRSYNVVNGLVYGNGSVKCWPRTVILGMNTHESSSDRTSAVDFCWTINYAHMKGCFSRTIPNGSPFQAYRAGFREGVKMLLDRGSVIRPSEYKHRLWQGNLDRLIVWCSVGMDVPNGLWSIYGARQAVVGMIDGFDHTVIADYDWFKRHWDDEVGPMFAGSDETCMNTGYSWDSIKLLCHTYQTEAYIRRRTGLDVALMTREQSTTAKRLMEQPMKTDTSMMERE